MAGKGSLSTSCRTASSEQWSYFLIFLIFALAYCFVGVVLPHFGSSGLQLRVTYFGFSEFLSLKRLLPVYSALVLVYFAGCYVRRLDPITFVRFEAAAIRIFSSPYFRVLISLLAMMVFFCLRTEYVNPDGIELDYKIPRDVPIKGAHVTHDEMLELYVHSRFWYYTNLYLGWSVKLSYEVLSSAAGGVFIFLLMHYCSALLPGRPIAAFLLCISGGYMQLFFGDVEDYTLTTMWLMGYFLTSLLFLQKRVSIIAPSVALAISLMFHLLSGFFMPSLLFLYFIAAKRGARASLVVAFTASVCIVGLTLLFFHYHNLPIENLWLHSHAFGHGGRAWNIVIPSVPYYVGIANLAFLLFPAFILIIPLLMYRRIHLDPINIHLAIACIFMTGFILVWRAALGIMADWNLFAAAALPLSFFVWRNVLSLESVKGLHPVFFLGGLFFVHSYSWILTNHFHPLQP